MPRCCICDFDAYAPSAFSTSVMSGSKAGLTRYRKKLGDYYCPGCYTSIMKTINRSKREEDDALLDDAQIDTDADILNEIDIYRNTQALSLREFE